MRNSISVAVLISGGRHPLTDAPRACRGDAVAMALGRLIGGIDTRVVHAGEMDEPALGDYLAMGAGRIEVLRVPAGACRVAALAAHLANVNVILTGLRAEVGLSSGLLPYALAQRLKRPLIPGVLSVEATSSDLTVQQFLPKGLRRSIASPLPVLLTVHPAAPIELTYAHARRLSGRIVEVAGSPVDLPAEATPLLQFEPASRGIVQLKAAEKASGHDRLHRAIAAEVKSGLVAFEGSDVDKAQVVLNYLREHRLVDL